MGTKLNVQKLNFMQIGCILHSETCHMWPCDNLAIFTPQYHPKPYANRNSKSCWGAEDMGHMIYGPIATTPWRFCTSFAILHLTKSSKTFCKLSLVIRVGFIIHVSQICCPICMTRRQVCNHLKKSSKTLICKFGLLPIFGFSLIHKCHICNVPFAWSPAWPFWHQLSHHLKNHQKP